MGVPEIGTENRNSQPSVADQRRMLRSSSYEL